MTAPPLPPPSVIASRDAKRLALVMRELGGEGEAVADGWMACDIAGSWADYAAGLGVAGPVDPAQLDRLVGWYRSRGRPPKIQVTPYQHASLLEGLAARRFAIEAFVTVLARRAEPLPVDRLHWPT